MRPLRFIKNILQVVIPVLVFCYVLVLIKTSEVNPRLWPEIYKSGVVAILIVSVILETLFLIQEIKNGKAE
jgi:hypothetical protein